jgi:hypothetical protein
MSELTITELNTMEENNQLIVVVNRGTGAGGANTNKNGHSYEEFTDLKTNYKTCDFNKSEHVYEVVFEGYDRTFVKVNKSELHTYMKKHGEKNIELQPAPGCLKPDEAYIDRENKIAIIIEKKFQQGTGSVDEKIQTGHFKKLHYQELFPNFKIYYIYCLSDWFKKNKYNSTLNYLKQNDIPIFWGSSETYKADMIEFINSL